MNDRNTPPKKDGVALWKAIQQAAIEDDANEILAMSDEELDQFISQNGGDPKAIRASGVALGKELLERRDRNAWHGEAHGKLEEIRARAAALKSKEKLPRPELLRRLELARNDARFATPVAALFQKKTPEASTDEELQALLDQIALLATMEDK